MGDVFDVLCALFAFLSSCVFFTFDFDCSKFDLWVLTQLFSIEVISFGHIHLFIWVRLRIGVFFSFISFVFARRWGDIAEEMGCNSYCKIGTRTGWNWADVQQQALSIAEVVLSAHMEWSLFCFLFKGLIKSGFCVAFALNILVTNTSRARD